MEPCVIVIPTYQEIGNIERIIFALEQVIPSAHIIVVDDSSIDGTPEAVEALQKNRPRLHLLRRTGAKNFAQSYVEGFLHAFTLGAEAVIQMDADFSHDPAMAPMLLQTLETCDMVVGSRYIRGGATLNWSRWRRALSYWGNRYAKACTKNPLQDLTSGFVAWRAQTLKKILSVPIELNGYAFQIELKCRAHISGGCIREIPIIFRERLLGKSKMSGAVVREAIVYCTKKVLEMK